MSNYIRDKKWGKNETQLASSQNPENKLIYSRACVIYNQLIAWGESDSESRLPSNLIETMNDDILNTVLRLIKGQVITPITEEEDCWVFEEKVDDNISVYKCDRYPSLTKYVNENTGDISYKDTSRVVYRNMYNDNLPSTMFAVDIIDELFPITLPYYPPDKPYSFYIENFKTLDSENEDTIGIPYVSTPEDKKEFCDLYYKKESDGKYINISKAEYYKRFMNSRR